MGREFELKFRADSEKIAAIREHFGDFTPISMETTYYDTQDRTLGKLHWTLRRRLENGVSVCTVKTPAPGGGRGEWEVRCGDIREGIPVLCNLGAPKELKRYTKEGVLPICGAKFIRLAKTIPVEGCTVELALDTGCLLGGGQELPFAEVEVEVKSGSEAAAAAFAQSLAGEFCLVPEEASKYKRALTLASANAFPSGEGGSPEGPPQQI